MLDMKGAQIEQILLSFLVLFSSAATGNRLIAAAMRRSVVVKTRPETSFFYGVSGFSLRDGVRSSGTYKGLRVGPGEVMGCLIRMPPLGRFSGTSN